MGFNISADAKRYFNKLDQDSKLVKLETMFDFYYFCLLIGFTNGKLSDGQSEEFLKSFPISYKLHSKEIIAALISAEIARRGINIEDRTRVQELILTLINPESPTNLSTNGETLMNKYAGGGFLIINDKFGQSHDVDTFLIRYNDELIANH